MELLLLIAILPVIFVGKYIYNKDKEKEPKKLLTKLLIGGVLSAIMVFLISIFLQSKLDIMSMQVEDMSKKQLIIYTFLCVAFIEEFSKYIFLYLFSFNSKEFNYTFDMIVYGVYVSLGFALLENILYIFSNGIIVGLLRAVTSVPSHACDGVFMGIFLSKAKEAKLNGKNSIIYKLLALIVPVIMHGLYDYLVFSTSYLVFFTILLFTFTITILLVRNKTLKDKKILFKDNYCSECGTKVTQEICLVCNRKNE